MTAMLNTKVNGSSGTCRAAAGWLSGIVGGTGRSRDEIQRAQNAAESGWVGPAHDAWHEDVSGMRGELDEIHEWVYLCERFLRDFADELDAVNKKMNEALDLAHGSGIPVQGPFILPPTPPDVAAQLSQKTKILVPDADGHGMRDINANVSAQQAARDTYTLQVYTFKEKIQPLVADARKQEQEAHDKLLRVFDRDDGGSPQRPTTKFFGETAAANALAYVHQQENLRQVALKTAEGFEDAGKTFTRYATGTLLNIGPKERARLLWSAEHCRVGAERAKTMAAQYEKKIGAIPEKVRGWIAADPGKTIERHLGNNQGALTRAGLKVLNSAPYIASGYTIANEVIQAGKGQQSWGKAAADSTGIIGGGTVGAAGASALAIALGTGGVGVIVIGAGGAILGSVAGQDVADYYVPE